MNGPIDPIRRSSPSRRALTVRQNTAEHDARETEPEDVVFVREEQPAPPPRKSGFATFAAHLMGQSGQKRGLRGGQEVLDSARSTYLGTEYSGEADRRPKAGLLRKTEI
ncbi:MAG: hypothetical protein B7Z44_07085 [Caulobacter sp. 12-67-6]|nr:MAG: hypothetical protein B7Z44_07085 [Caulobacter sp. 12-67-6]OYX73707.1 MAG: hypothetical protein B7Y81_02210 [Caulobacter sp. 32-67-35]OYX99951.1 MAG: hypothetical protein B7Y78_00070 [Caulobacter sp. 35-67-4]